VIGLLESLAQRRAALVERSARQRGEIASTLAGARRAVEQPLVLGLGAAVTLLSASPRMRTWFVRAWIAGAFLRRLLGR
jgi:hypothetical protein